MTVRLLVLASAVLVAVALAAGMGLGAPWSTWLLILTAMGQGALAGVAFPRFWRGSLREEAFGPGGRYLGFLAAVGFSAVEAHAVGAGIEKGAPAPAAALLLVPVALAAVALGSAKSRLDDGGGEGAADRSPEDGVGRKDGGAEAAGSAAAAPGASTDETTGDERGR